MPTIFGPAAEGTENILIALLSVTGFSIVARSTSNLVRIHKLFLEDYLAIIALAFLIVTTVLSIYFVHYLEGSWVTTPYLLQVIVVLINIFLNATIWLCKTPLIFLYLRLFHVKRWLRRACYAVLAIGFIPPAVALITTAVYCAPRNTEDVDKPVCGNMSGLFNTIIGLFSVLTDVALFIIPLPIIKELNLPTRRKIGLGSVFLVGIIAVVSSIVAFYFKISERSDTVTYSFYTIIFTVVELCTALIVSSAPALSGLYTGILANGEIYSRLRTKISMSLRRNQSDASGVEHTPDNGSGHSGWAHYEQLDDNAQFAKLGGQGEIVTSDIPMKSLPPSSRQHD